MFHYKSAAGESGSLFDFPDRRPNIGRTATLIGDPPNSMIGTTNPHLTFNDFLKVEKTFAFVEWQSIFFFVGLFILVGGLQEAEQVGPFESQVPDHSGDVVRHQLEAEGALDIGGVPVSLQLDGDDAPRSGKLWHNLSHRFDGVEGTGSSTSGCPLPCIS
jgi:hypothetical protein